MTSMVTRWSQQIRDSTKSGGLQRYDSSPKPPETVANKPSFDRMRYKSKLAVGCS